MCGADHHCNTSSEGWIKCMLSANKGEVPKAPPPGMKLVKFTKDHGALYLPLKDAEEFTPERAAEDAKREAEAKLKAKKKAQEVWQAAGPDRGRIAEYLAARGIDVAKLPGGKVPRALRWHEKCFERWAQGADGRYAPVVGPAMVAAFITADGMVQGIHRTFLDPGGAPRKRDESLGKAKMMLGGCRGRTIWLCEPGEVDAAKGGPGVACSGEGIETTLACMAATGWGGFAAGSGAGLAAIELPAWVLETGTRMVLCADLNRRGKKQIADGMPGVGVSSARIGANQLRGLGHRVAIAVPSVAACGALVGVDAQGFPTPAGGGKGVDWNDVLVTCGAEAVRSGLMAAEEETGEVVGFSVGEPGGVGGVSPAPVSPSGVVTRDGGGEPGGGGGGAGSDGGGEDGGGVEGGGDGGGGGERPWVRHEEWAKLPVLEEGPLERARRFLWERARIVGEGRFRVARWGGEWWWYAGGRYTRVPDEHMRSVVWDWMGGFRHWKRDRLAKYHPPHKAVTEVLGAIAVDTAVVADSMPARLSAVIEGGKPVWGRASDLETIGEIRVGTAAELRTLRARICFMDCVLDLEATAAGGRVVTMPHTPGVFHSTVLPFACPAEDLQRLLDGADAGGVFERLCPRLWAWIGEASQDDREWEGQLQEMLGDTISLDRTIEKIFLVVGPMRSGKGILEDVLACILGEQNVATTSFNAIAADRFALYPLLGKAAILMPDAHVSNFNDAKGAIEPLKVISGQGRIQVRDLYRPAMTVKLGGRLWIFANEEPDLRDDSAALAHRMIILPMRVSAADREDPHLKESVPREAPGIMLWALMGAIRLARMERRRIALCSDGRQYGEEFRERSAPLETFIKEWLVLEQNETVLPADLLDAYHAFCDAEERQALGRGKFLAKIKLLVPGWSTPQRRVPGTDLRPRVHTGCSLRTSRLADLTAWRAKSGAGGGAGGGSGGGRGARGNGAAAGEDRFWEQMGG